jgi:FkbM family methyltransferase
MRAVRVPPRRSGLPAAREARVRQQVCVVACLTTSFIVGLLLLAWGFRGRRVVAVLLGRRGRGAAPAAAVPPAVAALAAGCPGDPVGSTIALAESLLAAPSSLRTAEVLDPEGVVQALHPPGELVSDAIVRHRVPFCPAGLVRWMEDAAHAGETLTLIDAGANIGSCSLVAVALGHTAVAVEPLPANAALMLASLALSDVSRAGRLILAPFAAGAGNGSDVLLTTRDNMGASIVVREGALEDGGAAEVTRAAAMRSGALGRVPICVRTLDDILAAALDPASSPPVRALKMDVQGHEVAVLAGAGATLSAAPIDRIEAEIWPPVERTKGHNPQAVFDALGKRWELVEAGRGGALKSWVPPTVAEMNTPAGWAAGTAEAAGVGLVMDSVWVRKPGA